MIHNQNSECMNYLNNKHSRIMACMLVYHNSDSLWDTRLTSEDRSISIKGVIFAGTVLNRMGLGQVPSLDI